MKFLHTSDWHLGRTLYGRRRHEEFEAFLLWLEEIIQREKVEALLVAGDVFDTTTPGNRAQELYYRFLCRIAVSDCRHVVMIAGNHDSPSFLNAPRELLRALDVHVIGAITGSREDEVLVLRNREGNPELIVCAVPYLRDRDIRIVEAEETVADKERKLLDGIRDHYAEIVGIAEKRRHELGPDLPLVVMGHLFARGGHTVEGDGVRDLYVGSLAQVSAGIFPAGIDYLALGHLHVPQKVNGCETRRYSGSPLPMGFGEAGQEKIVLLVDVTEEETTVRSIAIPVFQELQRLRGDWQTINGRIGELAAAGASAWLEIVYEGELVIGDLRERLEKAVAGTGLEILRVRNDRLIERTLGRGHEAETLDDLDVDEVFDRCLTAHTIPNEQQPGLRQLYRETVASLQADDLLAE